MKKLKINRKLDLSKRTISELNQKQIDNVKGGSMGTATSTISITITTITNTSALTVFCQQK